MSELTNQLMVRSFGPARLGYSKRLPEGGRCLAARVNGVVLADSAEERYYAGDHRGSNKGAILLVEVLTALEYNRSLFNILPGRWMSHWN